MRGSRGAGERRSREAWDFVWTGTKGALDGSALGQPRVLLATGQALSTFTDRAPCRATLRYVPRSGPYVSVVRREANLDVASIATAWDSSYIDSTPSLGCFDGANGFISLTLASRAAWVPAQPLTNPSETVEQ